MPAAEALLLETSPGAAVGLCPRGHTQGVFGAVTWTSATDALCVVNAKSKKKEKELEVS